MKAWVGGLLAAVVLASGGCRRSAAPAAGESAAVEKKARAALDPGTLGTVMGTVTLDGKAPAPVKIDTNMDPACGMGGSGDVFSEQYVVHDGKLANVYVYVKNGPAAAMDAGVGGESGAKVVMDQKGCRYSPHVVALMRGESVEFRNSDVTMHNIHTMPANAANATDVSQPPKGAPQVKVFSQPEIMIPTRCNNHPWMNAFINVADTPFFAVTGADGRFEIKGLPAGDYTLAAIHEKLGEQEIHVSVTAQGTAKADAKFAMK